MGIKEDIEAKIKSPEFQAQFQNELTRFNNQTKELSDYQLSLELGNYVSEEKINAIITDRFMLSARLKEFCKSKISVMIRRNLVLFYEAIDNDIAHIRKDLADTSYYRLENGFYSKINP